MRNNALSRRGRWVLLLAVLVTIGIATGIQLWRSSPRTPRELRQSELTLRDGRLYAAGAKKPFNGLLYDTFSPEVRKLEIKIRDGKAHGRSFGYFDNGQLEVEEFFLEGVSHGLRTRWDEKGRKKSEAQIEHGKINGRYVEWHENGKMSVAMTLRDDQPEGVAEAWHPNGELKSRARFSVGKIIEREFFPDRAQTAHTAEAAGPP